MNTDITLIERLCSLQSELNEELIPNWKEQNFDWSTAIVVESAELIDSFAWKWWKAGKDDIENAKVEIIDLLHFYLAALEELDNNNFDCMLDRKTQFELAEIALAELGQTPILNLSSESLIAKVKHSMVAAINGEFATGLKLILSVGVELGMTIQEILALYYGKYALNQIRKRNGYQDGTYIKEWNLYGKEEEDNYWMQQLIIVKKTNKYIESPDEIIDTLQSFYNIVKDIAES